MIRRILFGLLFVLAVTAFAFTLLNDLIPEAKPRLSSQDFLVQKDMELRYVAVGDSLTEGVGDTSQQGGFVSRLAQSLSNDYPYEVQTENFGVGGNTSNQILERIQEDQALQEALSQADLMTLTVGGNDVMRVVQDNIATLEVTSFQQPAKEYAARLIEIIDLARASNPDLPIYVVGIYNPFYLNFPELTAMQEVVDNWNQVTEETVNQFDGVYFVPINDKIYKGTNGEVSISQVPSGNERVNDVLFEGDNFHPNKVGYQIIQAAILEKLNETSQIWQKN